MGTARRTLVGALALWAATLACPQVAHAGTGAVSVSGATVNVRDGAWGTIIGTASSGTAWVLTGAQDQGFLEIYFRGGRGWLHSSYVQSYSGTGARIDADALNVRETPGGQIVGQAHSGQVYVRGESDGSWERIRFDESSRWVHGAYTTDVVLGSGAPTATSALPAWLAPIMARACAREGLPASWATSPSLAELVEHESSFNPNAKNPSSTAYGLFQFLDATWSTVGGTKTSDPELQCVYGLRYVKRRYGSPEAAWDFWQKNHWY